MSDDYAPSEPVRDGFLAPFGNAVGTVLFLFCLPYLTYLILAWPGH